MRMCITRGYLTCMHAYIIRTDKEQKMTGCIRDRGINMRSIVTSCKEAMTGTFLAFFLKIVTKASDKSCEQKG